MLIFIFFTSTGHVQLSQLFKSFRGLRGHSLPSQHIRVELCIYMHILYVDQCPRDLTAWSARLFLRWRFLVSKAGDLGPCAWRSRLLASETQCLGPCVEKLLEASVRAQIVCGSVRAFCDSPECKGTFYNVLFGLTERML